MIAIWIRVARRFGGIALVVVPAVGLACDWADPPASPRIIAQGFDLNETRETRLGEAASVRVRIEVPGGVESLRIRERSYDADLARSPEASHYPLFGLERRVWSKTDVTLDFGPYLASKITGAGDYAIDIQVTDRADQTVGATLRLLVLPSPTPAPEDAANAAPPRTEPVAGTSRNPVGSDRAAAALLRSGAFRLERVGRGPVSHGDDFGIGWKTVERIHVVIRLSGGDEAGTRFAHLAPGTFAGIDTREELQRALDDLGLAPSLEIVTANDAAAGTEVAIVRPSGSTLLRADHSRTELSELGTTVTLTGHYKR